MTLFCKLLSLTMVLTLCKTEAQSYKTTGRMVDINMVFGQGRARTITVDQIPEGDEAINAIYADTKRGPYWQNRWFTGFVVVEDGTVLEAEEVSFRFDYFKQLLHFKGKDEKIAALSNQDIIGFIADDSTEFRSLALRDDKDSFAELLQFGDAYSLVRDYVSEVNSYMKPGPANDGKTYKEFKSTQRYYFSSSGKPYVEIGSNVKSLLKQFPELEGKYDQFSNNGKRLKGSDELIAFAGWLNSPSQ